jgi:hypothetical protein
VAEYFVVTKIYSNEASIPFLYADKHLMVEGILDRVDFSGMPYFLRIL